MLVGWFETIEFCFETSPVSLNTLSKDEIVIKIFDEESPCFIQEKEDSNFLSVIMPMKM